jgi:O-antigen ligase
MQKRQSQNNAVNLRLKMVIWTVSISTAALGLVGMIQRFDKTNKLLWVIEDPSDRGWSTFGPFAYQSSGAQLLNLIWPITLGFWLDEVQFGKRSRPSKKIGDDPNLVLLLCTAVMIISGFCTDSKIGFVVLLIHLSLIGGVAIAGSMLTMRSKLVVVPAVILTALAGFALGGRDMIRRFETADFRTINGRIQIYEDATEMAKDFILYGSGAETFAPLYYFYRKNDPVWNAYVHNDYLETLITFGLVGAMLLLLIFITILLISFVKMRGQNRPALIKLIFLSMTGILFHAAFDMPFQILGILFEFTVVCAILVTVKNPVNSFFPGSSLFPVGRGGLTGGG